MRRDISGTIREVCRGLENHLESMRSAELTPRPIPLERLRNFARESYQDLLREDALRLIRRLKGRDELTREDMETLDDLMVGDLEMYEQIEVHFAEWTKLIKEGCHQLQSLDGPGIESDAARLLKLQALAMDLEHLLADFDRYKYALDRLRRYKANVGLDPSKLTSEQRNHLAEQLRAMVYSSDL